VPEPTDDDEILDAAGFRQFDERRFPGSKTDLVLQRWER
jgi:mannosyltransferase